MLKKIALLLFTGRSDERICTKNLHISVLWILFK